MRTLSIFLAVIVAQPAMAGDLRPETAAQYSKLDSMAEYAIALSFCERIGFTVDQTGIDAVQARAVAEAVAGGMTQQEVEDTLKSRLDAHLTLLKRELASSLERVKGATKMRPVLETLVNRRLARCNDVAAEPIFAPVIKPLPPAQAADARRTMIDELVYFNGEASWQDAAILARGDFLLGVGACKHRLSAGQVEALTAPYISGAEPKDPTQARIRRYYAEAYMEGISSAEEFDFDDAQCARLMATRPN